LPLKRLSKSASMFALGQAQTGTLVLWSMRSGGVLANLLGGSGGGGEPHVPLTADFNHNATLLAAGFSDGTTRIYDMRSRGVIMTWQPHGRGSGGGDHAAGAGGGAGPGGDSVAAAGAGADDARVTCVRFSPDDTSVTVATGGGAVVRRSLFRDNVVEMVYAGIAAGCTEVSFSADGRHFAAVADGGGQCAVFAVAGREPVLLLGAGGSGSGNGSGSGFGSGGGSGSGGSGSGGSGSAARAAEESPGRRGGIWAVDWHPDDNVIVTGDGGGAIRLSGLRQGAI
jgi:WD40 repeat protein